MSKSSILRVICLVLFITSIPAIEAKPKIGKLPKESVANNQIKTLDGRQFTLAGLRGNVVVLNFFAVWCGHSKQLIPTLTKYGEAEAQRGLQIIGLAVKDAEATPERISKFISDLKINYPVGLIRDPVFMGYVESKNVSVPQTLVYARDGRLVTHFTGHDQSVDAELASVIERELNHK